MSPSKWIGIAFLLSCWWPTLAVGTTSVAPTVAGQSSICDEVLAKPNATITKSLIKIGYDKAIAERIATRNPGLAKNLSKSKKGGPQHVFEWNSNSGGWVKTKSTAIYRGVDLHPYDFDPKYISSINKNEINGGRLLDAEISGKVNQHPDW